MLRRTCPLAVLLVVAGQACQATRPAPCAPCDCEASSSEILAVPVVTIDEAPKDASGAAGEELACATGGPARHALAMPHGDSDIILLVLSDVAITCSEWYRPPDRDGCTHWTAHIWLPAAMQQPGSYAMGEEQYIGEDDFDDSDDGPEVISAGLQRWLWGKKGAWQDEPRCDSAGGDLEGTLALVRVDADGLVGKICGSRTDDDPRNSGLLDGNFRAEWCPRTAARPPEGR